MSVNRGVLWDSSAILALLDANDADHGRAVQIATRIASERKPSFIMNYIEAEARALLLRKLGRMLAREWLLTEIFPFYEYFRQRRIVHGRSLRGIQTRTGAFATPFPLPSWRLVASVALSHSITTSFRRCWSKA